MFPFLPASSAWTDGVRIQSRSASPENPTGEPGAGGRAASPLGRGRKGRPCVPIDPGATLTLASIEGSGCIRRLWVTVADRTDAAPFVLRDLVLRAHWDGAAAPSVEVPLGDFFCNGFATRCLVNSALVVVAPTGGMNSFFPMPFRRSAHITVTSEHPGPIEGFFFQVDYQLSESPGRPAPYFHALWRRTPYGSAGTDHIIADGLRGPGAYAGTYIGVAALQRYWWGEGEVKFFIDSDDEYPTICGTGLEDYVGGAWAFQDRLTTTGKPQVSTFCSPYLGYPQRITEDASQWSPYAWPSVPQHGLYRWHVPDPVYFAERLKVTVQQIGHDGERLFERQDDVCSVAYWYQDQVGSDHPAIPPAADRRPR